MSKGNVKNNNNGNSNGFLISKNQTSRFSANSRASLTQALYVSLDNADKVIEGGPLKPFFAKAGAVHSSFQDEHYESIGASPGPNRICGFAQG